MRAPHLESSQGFSIATPVDHHREECNPPTSKEENRGPFLAPPELRTCEDEKHSKSKTSQNTGNSPPIELRYLRFVDRGHDRKVILSQLRRLLVSHRWKRWLRHRLRHGSMLGGSLTPIANLQANQIKRERSELH
jgi:hypothetical protein